MFVLKFLSKRGHKVRQFNFSLLILRRSDAMRMKQHELHYDSSAYQ